MPILMYMLAFIKRMCVHVELSELIFTPLELFFFLCLIVEEHSRSGGNMYRQPAFWDTEQDIIFAFQEKRGKHEYFVVRPIVLKPVMLRVAD